MGSVRGFLITIAIVLLPTAARAQSAAQDVAARASQVHAQYCAEVASTSDEGTAARGIVEVGEVWAEVAEVHAATGASWLLYWRGVLAQCIGQDERAAEALIGFVESSPEADGMNTMDRDARKRLSWLKPDYEPPQPVKPPRTPPTPEERARAGRIAGGLVLALGAAGAGAGSGFGFLSLSGTHLTLTTATHSTANVEGLLDQGDGQMAVGIGLAAGATVAAIASIATFVSAGKEPHVEAGLSAVPLDGGVALVLGGRW
jgi:hypothetical protein